MELRELGVMTYEEARDLARIGAARIEAGACHAGRFEGSLAIRGGLGTFAAAGGARA